MHGLILAGGEGSRLLATGIAVPKALVPVARQPQVRRLVEACRRVGCETVTCAVRDDLVAAVAVALADTSVTIVPLRTATSLHTLEAGLRNIVAGNVLCSLVDTVMPAGDWDAAHAAAVRGMRDADAVIAVTPFIDDESPLWADVDANGIVVGFTPGAGRRVVTGGVYWFNARARAAASEAVQSGVMRMRGFLARLIDTHHRVRAVEVRQIVDVDTSADLVVARALVEGELA
jgi:NDP-sugar pyrophosphorylase family protein